MSPEQLANDFVRVFDKLSNDNKSKCLTEIASIFSTKYDLNLGYCMESKTDGLTDEYFIIPLANTNVSFTWDEDCSNLEWSVFGINDK